ncbi:uncharacterized protein LOC126687843 [Mercurialis annua]|uniref:uncharacterized protein LOC126687843 n=1 Tax=Mercurialis annua TaxID=3986 RepID=UPI0021610479|nr:uncharacterized protein LOC126687843 [Mercurialis annua]
MAEVDPPKKWNALFTGNQERTVASELEFISPAIKNGERVVTFESNEIRAEEEKWKNAIVGCVYGMYPRFERIAAFVKNRWGNRGLRNVHRINSSMFLFEFDSEQDCNGVLGSGPYTFDQRPFLLKKWQPRMAMDLSVIKSVPVWIQLPGLPWEFWTSGMLSKIGSFCGNPLYCDQCTINRTKLAFARLLVEMDTTGSFPDTVQLQDEKGNCFVQRIVYEWKPVYCDICRKMGHSKYNCRSVVKTKQAEKTIPEAKCSAQSSAVKEDGELKENIVDQVVIVEKIVQSPPVIDGAGTIPKSSVNKFDVLADDDRSVMSNRNDGYIPIKHDVIVNENSVELKKDKNITGVIGQGRKKKPTKPFEYV